MCLYLIVYAIDNNNKQLSEGKKSNRRFKRGEREKNIRVNCECTIVERIKCTKEKEKAFLYIASPVSPAHIKFSVSLEPLNALNT